MNLGRLAASVALVALTAGGLVAVATPSQAATGTIDCATDTSPADFSLTAGETLTLTLSNCYGVQGAFPSAFATTLTAIGSVDGVKTVCGATPTAGCSGWSSPAYQSFSSATIVAPSTDQSLATQIAFNTTNTNTMTLDFLVRVSVTGGSSPSSSSTSSQTPPSHLQQVGLPASGECTDIDDSGLAWGTGLTGGWTKAWGEWLNNGLGGWACSRTLQYSTPQAAWVIAS